MKKFFDGNKKEKDQDKKTKSSITTNNNTSNESDNLASNIALVSDNFAKQLANLSNKLTNDLVKTSDKIAKNLDEIAQSFSESYADNLVTANQYDKELATFNEDKSTNRDLAFEGLKLINDVLWKAAEIAVENEKKAIKLSMWGFKTLHIGILSSAIHVAKALAEGKDLNKAIEESMPELGKEIIQDVIEILASAITKRILGKIGSKAFGVFLSEIIFPDELNRGEREWVIEMSKKHNMNATSIIQEGHNILESNPAFLQPTFPSFPEASFNINKPNISPNPSQPPINSRISSANSNHAAEERRRRQVKFREESQKEREKFWKKQQEERKKASEKLAKEQQAFRQKVMQEFQEKRKREDKKKEQEQELRFKANCESLKHSRDPLINRLKASGNPSSLGVFSTSSKNTPHRSICENNLSSKKSYAGIGIGLGNGPVRVGYVPHTKK